MTTIDADTPADIDVPAPREPRDGARRRRTRRNRPADTIKVRDQDRVLEFVGERIGFASSESPTSLRWTEIEIYRTEAGNYVVHRIGVSLVFHVLTGGSGRNCKSGRVTDGADIMRDRDAEPCPDCRPVLMEVERYRQETDRHSAEAVAEPQELMKALSLTRENGAPYLSAVASAALREAAEHDQRLASLVKATVYVA